MNRRIQSKKSGASELVLPKLTTEEEWQLDYDVCCCIEELEKVLQAKNSSEKQRKMADISLKILRNPEETFIKKKQVMRQQMGDYRSKFENKKKTVVSQLNENKVTFKKSNTPQNPVYFRKRTKKTSGTAVVGIEDINVDIDNLSIENGKIGDELVLQKPNNSFKFNF